MYYRHCGLSDVLLITVYSFQRLHVTYRTLSKLISISSKVLHLSSCIFGSSYINLLNLLNRFNRMHQSVIFVLWLGHLVNRQSFIRNTVQSAPFTQPISPPMCPPTLLWRLCLTVIFSLRVPPPTLFLLTSHFIEKNRSFLPQNLKASVQDSYCLCPSYNWVCPLLIKGLSLYHAWDPILLIFSGTSMLWSHLLHWIIPTSV